MSAQRERRLELRCRAGSHAGHTDIGVGRHSFCLECALQLIVDTKLCDRRAELTCALVPLVRQSRRLERGALDCVQRALITALSKDACASASLQSAIIALGPLSVPSTELVLTPSALHGRREAKGLIATLNEACEVHPETRQSIAVVLASEPELCAHAVRNLANDEFEHAASIAFILGAAVQDDSVSTTGSRMCTKHVVASVADSATIVVDALVQSDSTALRRNTLTLLVLLCRNGYSADEVLAQRAFDALVRAQLVKVMCRVLLDHGAESRHLATYLTHILLVVNPRKSSVFRRECASERLGSYMIQGACEDGSMERDCELLILGTLLELSQHERIAVSLTILAGFLQRATTSSDPDRAAVILNLIPRLRAEAELANGISKVVEQAARATILWAKMRPTPEMSSPCQVISIAAAGIRAISHLLPACTPTNSCLSMAASTTCSESTNMQWASATLEAVELCTQLECMTDEAISALRCFEQLATLCCRWWPKGATQDEALACTCSALRDALLKTLDGHIVPRMAAHVDMDAALAAAFIRTVRTGLNLECPSLPSPSSRTKTENRFSVVRAACAGLPHFVLQLLVQFGDTNSNHEPPADVVSEGTAILVDLLTQSGLCNASDAANEISVIVASLRRTSDATTLVVGLARLLDGEFTCTLLALLYLCVCVEEHVHSSVNAGGLYASVATYCEAHAEAISRLPERSLLLFIQVCSVVSAPHCGGRPLPARAQGSVCEAVLSRPSMVASVLSALHKPSLFIACPTAVLRYLVRQHMLNITFCELVQEMLSNSVLVSSVKASVCHFGALLTSEPQGYNVLAELINMCQEDRLQSTLGFVLDCVLCHTDHTGTEVETVREGAFKEAKAMLANAVMTMLERLTQPAQACSAFVLLALLLRIARALLSSEMFDDRNIVRYYTSLSRVLRRCDTRRQPICTVPIDTLHAVTHLAHTIFSTVGSCEKQDAPQHSIFVASLHAATRFTTDVLQQSALPLSTRAAATAVAGGLFVRHARVKGSAHSESSDSRAIAVVVINAAIDMLMLPSTSAGCRCAALIGIEAVLHGCAASSLFHPLHNMWCPLLYCVSCAFCDDVAAHDEPLLRQCAVRSFIRMYELAAAAEEDSGGQSSILLLQLRQYGWLRFVASQALRGHSFDEPALEILSLVTLLQPSWMDATFRGDSGGAAQILSALEHMLCRGSWTTDGSRVQLSCAILHRLAQQGILEVELAERAESKASEYAHKKTQIANCSGSGSRPAQFRAQTEDICVTVDPAVVVVIPAQSGSQSSIAVSSWLSPSSLVTACDESVRPPAPLPLCAALRAVATHA